MPLENLTSRENLALDLERCARRLRNLVARYAADVGAVEAPSREDLDRVVVAIRAVDRVGRNLAPDLYCRALISPDGESE